MSDDPPTLSAPAPERWAAAARVWTDVAIRVALVLAVTLILIDPGRIPLLKQFVVKSAKINMFGQELEVAQIGSLFPSVTIEGDKLLLKGQDVSLLPDENARLRTSNSQLEKEKAELTGQITRISALLKEAIERRETAAVTPARPPDAPTPARPPDAATPARPPAVTTPATPSDTETLTGLLGKLQQEQQAHASAVYAAPAVAPEPVPASTALPFGIVFGADSSRDAAMDEVRKAEKISKAPITLFKRQGTIRSVAGFATRDDANAALPVFARMRSDSYVVDLRSWCPAAFAAGASATGTPPLVDCKY